MHLVQRLIRMGELAFIERGTNLLFIPLVDEIWLDEETGKFARILKNKHRSVNFMTDYFKKTYIPVDMTWNVLFLADPNTMIIKDL